MPNEPLLVGHAYEAIGPREGSKLGPPQRVTVVGVSERGYITEGQRQVAPLILFGCERLWRPVPAQLPEHERPRAVVAAWSPWEGWE